MRIGIVCATDNELAPFLREMRISGTMEKAMLKFHIGQIAGADAVAVFSGVCKVNAAIAAQLLTDEFGVDIIINAGVAGGLSDELQAFDTVISTEICYHDVAPDILTEFHPWMKSIFFEADSRLVELSRSAVGSLGLTEKVLWGRMATGEAFIAGEGRQKIIDELHPLTVDMETASFAHVCYANGIPFIAIRSVTDTASDNASESFEENCVRASETAKSITVALISALSGEQSQ